MGLTPAQERVYRFVRDFLQEHGYSPSYEEIRRHLGYRSLNAVADHLKKLEERGYLQGGAMKNQKRALKVVPLRTGAASIPFLGVVVAGTPIEAVEVPESIEVPESFLGSGSNFALRVRGHSMIEEGIREGDILIVSKQSHAENGQTVVALVRGEATVKKFYGHGDLIELRPANRQMEAIRANAADVVVVGGGGGAAAPLSPAIPAVMQGEHSRMVKVSAAAHFLSNGMHLER
jgi:repressor LexA